MNINTVVNANNNVYADEKLSFSDMPKRFPRHRNEALVSLAGSGHRVLEIGCGGGNVLYNLKNRFDELYGLEISPIRAEKVKKELMRNGLKDNILVGNIEDKLEFSEGFFDVIVWADVIEHVVDLWSAMAEIKRLLATNGRLVTCTPNIAELRRRLLLLIGRFPSTGGTDEGLNVKPKDLFDGGHLHYFTFSSLAKLYRRYDIEPTESLGFGRLGRFHNIYPPLFSSAICLVGRKHSEEGK
ncbi:class I SAM-dependent methyltransferase [Coleofasciculus sp. FACHB-SPT9]|uniref:class I SAM-dependent methyltransferase n=1 Tax=Cyanophyceae TaxID=3028117 RepID=UPI001686AC49|nr:class I SAM-dependent methyltransferase [Coleofasciculus sp. FACHB-SPT9]MBD1889378.1 class I SAM-dependent methyltransferase [Coleofasciculus sp. FACHB-SPT9]